LREIKFFHPENTLLIFPSFFIVAVEEVDNGFFCSLQFLCDLWGVWGVFGVTRLFQDLLKNFSISLVVD
jgi:hypothetical protein